VWIVNYSIETRIRAAFTVVFALISVLGLAGYFATHQLAGQASGTAENLAVGIWLLSLTSIVILAFVLGRALKAPFLALAAIPKSLREAKYRRRSVIYTRANLTLSSATSTPVSTGLVD